MVIFAPKNKEQEVSNKPLDIIQAVNDTLAPSLGKLQDENKVKEIYNEYIRGNTGLCDIAFKYGIAQTTLARRFRRLGLQLKKKGNRQQRTRSKRGQFQKGLAFTKNDIEKIYNDYMSRNGTTIREIAIAYNLEPKTLYYLFRLKGLPRKPRKKNKNYKEWSYRDICVLKNMLDEKSDTAHFLVQFPSRSISEIQEKIRWMGYNYRLTIIKKEQYGASSKNGDL